MNNINNIIRDLNIVSVKGRKRYYTLSYRLQKKGCDKKLFDPQEMDSEDIMWYVVNNYKLNTEPNKNKLINDLIIFKSYKDDLEIKRSLQNFFIAFITGIITITIALISLNIDLKNFGENNVPPKFKMPEIQFSEIRLPNTSMELKPGGINVILVILKYLSLILDGSLNLLNASFYIAKKVFESIVILLINEFKYLFIELIKWKGPFVVILIIASCIIVTFIYYFYETRIKSSYNKIKTLNNVIYFLEEINKSL